MKIFDISRRLQDAPVYHADEPAEIHRVLDMNAGDLWNVSMITAGSHLGTHADAFSHFFADGLPIDKMPLEYYCGPCRVLSVEAEELVRVDDIRGRIEGAERIVLHTGGQIFLCEQAASYLVECGVKLLVVDAMSVAPDDNALTVHRILLGGGVAIVENADLTDVPDGEYLIFAFPVKIGGCDGAPVRAVLLQADDEAEPTAEESAEASQPEAVEAAAAETEPESAAL